MKTLAVENNSFVVEVYKPEYILADWVTAITTLYNYHHQLVICINQPIIEPDLRVGNPIYIGQCPVSLLVELINAMQEELKKLGQDMDQLTDLRTANTAKKYKKLMIHTRVLNQLNQQAQRGLYLSILHSS